MITAQNRQIDIIGKRLWMQERLHRICRCVLSLGGYDTGFLPPTRCSRPFGVTECSAGNSSTEPYIAGHHMLLAHASAARLYEKNYKVNFKIFSCQVLGPCKLFDQQIFDRHVHDTRILVAQF